MRRFTTSAHRFSIIQEAAGLIRMATVALLAMPHPTMAQPTARESASTTGVPMDYKAVFNAPPRGVPTQAMPDGPLLGNGDVGVVLAGPPEAQRFHIGKNDFWTRTPGDAKVITVGAVKLSIPALQGASYRQEQDMARAEVRGTFSKGKLTVRTRSWVDANANLLLTQVGCEGAPVTLSVRLSPGAGTTGPPSHVADTGTLHVGREQYGGGRWYFDGELANVVVTNAVLNGQPTGQPANPERFDGKSKWREMAAPRVDRTVSVAAWIRIGGASPEANYIVSKGEWNQAYSLGLSAGRLRWAINGTFLQTKQALEKDKWLYVVGVFDGKQIALYVDGVLRASMGETRDSATDWFTRKADDLPGRCREVAVATRVIGVDGLRATIKPGEMATVATAILSDLDERDFLATARENLADLTPQKVEEVARLHRAWWTAYWARSFIVIPDKEIERHWYAALYALGSCSRPGKVAPGLWGNWLTTDNPNWHGDFHLNYNFQAPYYLVYGANHVDLSLPFYQAILESMDNGRAMAKRHGWKGVHFPVCIGPWGLSPENPDGDWGQRSNAAYAALNFICYWQYTQDVVFLRQTAFPYLREVAGFWEDYLKLENGSYVIYNDSIHEGSGPDFNPLLSLGLVRALFKNLLAMSRELGVDADKRAQWQDILDRFSAFPVQERNGSTVFRYSEKGMAWCDANTLGIQHIFPAGAIGMDSDPKLLAISRNTIDAMARWSDGNGFCSWYSACARVGYDPKRILTGLRGECDTRSAPNLLLQYGGGGIENCSGFLAINEMLLQSHEGVIRLFPCWPREMDARFGTLRAVGAFLVSAELKSGIISGVRFSSERGRPCTIANPWPGREVQVIRNGTTGETAAGDRFTLQTAVNEVVQLIPKSLVK
jgi:alpha-L-fucosidase 2